MITTIACLGLLFVGSLWSSFVFLYGSVTAELLVDLSKQLSLLHLCDNRFRARELADTVCNGTQDGLKLDCEFSLQKLQGWLIIGMSRFKPLYSQH